MSAASEVFTHRVELFTGHLRVAGEIQTFYRGRLSDILNAHDQTAINLLNARLLPTGRGAEPSEALTDVISTAKREVLFAATQDALGESAAPATGGAFHRVEKIPHRIEMYLGPYRIEGNIHLIKETQLRDALDAIRDVFIAVTDTVITRRGESAGFRLEHAFVSVNKERIAALFPVAALPQ
ncbi:MAG: hypothetical protein ACE5NC_09730 [Anaerolineae bacterium]